MVTTPVELPAAWFASPPVCTSALRRASTSARRTEPWKSSVVRSRSGRRPEAAARRVTVSDDPRRPAHRFGIRCREHARRSSPSGSISTHVARGGEAVDYAPHHFERIFARTRGSPFTATSPSCDLPRRRGGRWRRESVESRAGPAVAEPLHHGVPRAIRLPPGVQVETGNFARSEDLWPSRVSRGSRSMRGATVVRQPCRERARLDCRRRRHRRWHHRLGRGVPSAPLPAGTRGGARTGIAELAPAPRRGPSGVRRARERMDAAMRGHPYVKSAIDMACWDILGKASGLSATLMGGHVGDDFALYQRLAGVPEQMAGRIAAYRKEGTASFSSRWAATPTRTSIASGQRRRCSSAATC
jgi:hypothetical protein